MPVVRDPIAGLVRRQGDGQDDPILNALRHGEDVPDRRAHLLRLYWDGTLSYEEGERLTSEDEIDELCDLVHDMEDKAIIARTYAIDEAQRGGWILSDADRDWFRRECNLPPIRDWTPTDESRLSLWRRGVRLEAELEHVAQWLLDTRIPYAEIFSRLTTAESRLVHQLVDPGQVARQDARQRERSERIESDE